MTDRGVIIHIQYAIYFIDYLKGRKYNSIKKMHCIVLLCRLGQAGQVDDRWNFGWTWMGVQVDEYDMA